MILRYEAKLISRLTDKCVMLALGSLIFVRMCVVYFSGKLAITRLIRLTSKIDIEHYFPYPKQPSRFCSKVFPGKKSNPREEEIDSGRTLRLRSAFFDVVDARHCTPVTQIHLNSS